MGKSKKSTDKVANGYIDFDIINEKWHVYELEDDSIIRFKTVLTAIFDAGPAEEETGISGMRKAFFSARLLSSVFSPKDIRGKKGKSWSISELEKFKTQTNLKFRQIKDGGIAEYDTKNSIITIKSWLRQVDKTSKFDGFGNPAYIIRTESQILTVKKPSTQKE